MSFVGSRSYKVRAYSGKAKNGTAYTNYSLTVPNEIAESLPEEITFVVTMTEDGILYQPRSLVDTQIELPEWAKVSLKAKKSQQEKSQPSEQEEEAA